MSDAEFFKTLAERAKQRKAVRDLLDAAQWDAYRADAREDVAKWLAENPMTLDDAREWLAREWGCACIGGPAIGWPCNCHLNTELALRALDAAGEPLPNSNWERLP